MHKPTLSVAAIMGMRLGIFPAESLSVSPRNKNVNPVELISFCGGRNYNNYIFSFFFLFLWVVEVLTESNLNLLPVKV